MPRCTVWTQQGHKIKPCAKVLLVYDDVSQILVNKLGAHKSPDLMTFEELEEYVKDLSGKNSYEVKICNNSKIFRHFKLNIIVAFNCMKLNLPRYRKLGGSYPVILSYKVTNIRYNMIICILWYTYRATVRQLFASNIYLLNYYNNLDFGLLATRYMFP